MVAQTFLQLLNTREKQADFLRNLGYQVDELPRGRVVTWNKLKEYTKVIRAHSMGDYSPQEIAA